MTSQRTATLVALMAAFAMAVMTWTWRTGAVGGSDSACYALMARVFAEGRLQPTSALATMAPWPDATLVAAPAGFLPSAVTAGAAVPVCAPGYSLLLAPLVRLGGPGAVYAIPPLAASGLVWVAFLIARRLHSAWAGVGAALLVAVNPIVLFQAVQPMNDITTGALWLAAAFTALTARPLATGVLVGLGLLVRPNLALAGAGIVLACAWLSARASSAARARTAVRAALVTASAAAPGVAAALTLNAALYGSPLRSGYGDLGALFAWTYLPVNLAHYGRAWIMTSSPLVVAAVAAPWLVRRERRVAAAALIGMAALLGAVYLIYRPFPEWWYLRFLLPAVAVSLVLAAVATMAATARVMPTYGVAVGLAVIAAAASWSLVAPETREARGLQKLESRFALTATVVATRLPADAVVISVWQSGGVRFWPGREVIVWDALDPAWLDRAVAWLDERGRPAAIVIEQWEEESFRRRFAGQTLGALDWPPRFDVDRRVRIYLPADRARYLLGKPIQTESVLAPRRSR